MFRKASLITIGFLVLSAVLAAAAIVQRAADPPAPISQVLSGFIESNTPTTTLDLQSLYGGQGRLSLIDPASSLPQSHRHRRSELAGLRAYAESCADDLVEREPAPALSKTWLWHRHICGAPLPAGFFGRPPFMHPLGHSFAALALVRLLEYPSADSAPPVAAPEFLHASELGLAMRLGIPLSREHRIIRSAPSGALFRADPIIFGPEFVLLRTRAPRESTAGAFGAYQQSALVEWTEASGWRIDAAVGGRCEASSQLTPELCYRRVRPRIAAGVFLGGSMLCLLLSTVTLGSSWLRSRARHRNEHQLMVRTLAHELRTPMTALKLSLEPLRDDFDVLSADGQTAFLRLAQSVAHLQRSVDMTSRYAELFDQASPMGVERSVIDSVNSFLDDLMTAYGNDVSLRALSSDRAVRTSPLWLGICVRNLIDNAINHGKPPVEVSLAVRESHLEVSVRDQGRMARRDTVSRLYRPFSKGRVSGGLGLGLAIVSRAAVVLGGGLTHTKRPSTTFVLTIGIDP